MIFSWQLSLSLAKYIMGNRLRGRKRFPLVLMLEPTFRCNLACAGCGRIREYHDVLDEMLSVEDCLASVEEAGAPVVSITGGEPLLHPDIGEIVAGIIARKRFVHLCTNGLLLESSLAKFKPSPYMSFALHLDGLAASAHCCTSILATSTSSNRRARSVNTARLLANMLNSRWSSSVKASS